MPDLPQDRWTLRLLDELFEALASCHEIQSTLVFKGARVLRLRLAESLRASYDIDAAFAANFTDDASTRDHLRTSVERSVRQFFERQSPIRYSIERSTLKNRRQIGPHPRGWDVYWLEFEIRDLAARDSATSTMRVDIAAPERMSLKSVAPLVVGHHTVQAITLERIAGEKLRAYLSCLPSYRRKIGEKTQVARRVKDIYDLARILRKRSLQDELFWTDVAIEFRLACESRCIDCNGMESFLEDWDGSLSEYETLSQSGDLPGDVTLADAMRTLLAIVDFLVRLGIFPITNAL